MKQLKIGSGKPYQTRPQWKLALSESGTITVGRHWRGEQDVDPEAEIFDLLLLLR